MIKNVFVAISSSFGAFAVGALIVGGAVATPAVALTTDDVETTGTTIVSVQGSIGTLAS